MNRFNVGLGVLAVGGAAYLGYLVLSKKPVVIPANVTVQPADTAGFRGYLLGSAEAPVEITEYADYQCPACAGYESVQFPDVKSRLIDAGKVRWRYRDFPLPMHPHARVAAHAAACADEQGKFWPVHNEIYAAQTVWSPKASAADDFRGFAEKAGVDLPKYDACMQSAKYAGRIEASRQEAMEVGAPSTPTMLIGGKLYPGGLPFDDLKQLVDSLAAASAPAPAAAK